MEHTPSGGADPGTAAGEAGEPLSIGAVLRVLREEFPQVTVSKIRFLETEGLVEPGRSPSGYRRFRAGDVERLGRILRMQRDHYLPLRVIREELDESEDAGPPPVPVQAAALGRPACGRTDPSASRRVDRDELITTAEVTDAELTAWESCGLLTPDVEGSYGADALTVARLLAELTRSGIRPSGLRAVKLAADREADMVKEAAARLEEQENSPGHGAPDATVRELATLSAQLHTALVQTALRPHSR